MNFEPGEKHLYSNSNYVLLSEIISRVSDLNFRDFIQQEIFLPLGMLNTKFTDSNSVRSIGQTQAYYINEKSKFESVNDMVPVTQDQIITTIEDFRLWIQNLNTKKVGGDKLYNLLSQKDSLSNGNPVNYSFGLREEQY